MFPLPNIDINIMLKIVLLATLVLVCHGRQREEAQEMAGCDPDFGWSNGADGSGKCYRLIRNVDYT